MPPKRKEAVAKNKNEAPPAKTTKSERKIKSEKTPSELPDQGTSGGMAAFKPLAKQAEELDTEQFSQFLEQNTELLELFSNLRGKDMMKCSGLWSNGSAFMNLMLWLLVSLQDLTRKRMNFTSI